MSGPTRDHDELLSALDKMFSKYFEERDDSSNGKSPEGKFWGTYLRAMKDEDEKRPRDWDGNTGSILTFSGLFAATVAAFVIESYRSLSPDSGDQTVLLLSQIFNATTNTSLSASTMPVEPFRASPSAVITNILWFCSLLIVLACALLATLVQQWSRDYTRDIKRRDVLDESLVSRAYNHVYIRMGVDRYGMDEVVNLLVSLVHLSVILFAVGLLLFLFPIDSVVAWCTLSVLSVFGLLYFAASLLSIFDTSCPYRTPLTYPLSFGHWLLGRVSHFIHDMLRQRDFSPLIEAVLEWWYEALPPFSTQLVPRRRVVYSPPVSNDFLTVLRFKFAWLHTSRHMFDSDNKALLQFVMTKLASMPEELREECIQHLESDEQLKLCFRPIGSYWPGSVDYATNVVGYQMCCVLFQRFYSGYLRANRYEQDRSALDRYLQVVVSGVTTSSITTHSTMSTLLTRFTLFHVRWYILLTFTYNDHDSQFDVDVLQVMSSIFKDHGGSVEFTQDTDDQRGLRTYYGIADRPWTLLHLLNSWRVNSMDRTRHSDDHVLEESTRSCLIPLHDGVCCTQNDTIHHMAACSVLTMIAHLLRAPEGDRMELLHRRYEYDSLFNQGVSPFVEWIGQFDVPNEERQSAPSAEFKDVLRDARLSSWLVPGNDLSYVPSYGTSEGRLLRYKVSTREYIDGALSPPALVSTFVDVLRALARRVNFSASHLVESHEPPSDPNVDAGAAPGTDFGSQSESESGSSAHPVAGQEFPVLHSSAASLVTAVSSAPMQVVNDEALPVVQVATSSYVVSPDQPAAPSIMHVVVGELSEVHPHGSFPAPSAALVTPATPSLSSRISPQPLPHAHIHPPYSAMYRRLFIEGGANDALTSPLAQSTPFPSDEDFPTVEHDMQAVTLAADTTVETESGLQGLRGNQSVLARGDADKVWLALGPFEWFGSGPLVERKAQKLWISTTTRLTYASLENTINAVQKDMFLLTALDRLGRTYLDTKIPIVQCKNARWIAAYIENDLADHIISSWRHKAEHINRRKRIPPLWKEYLTEYRFIELDPGLDGRDYDGPPLP